MRRAKRILYRRKVETPCLVLDEAGYHFDDANHGRLLAPDIQDRQPPILVTQAIIRANSGKRLRFFGCARWSDTGLRVEKRPQRFAPIQVRRRWLAHLSRISLDLR